jgi:hypothetical protein
MKVIDIFGDLNIEVDKEIPHDKDYYRAVTNSEINIQVP